MRTAILSTLTAALFILATPAADIDKAEGWQTLFNGKDLTGWQNAAGKAPGSGWVVEEGAMVRMEKERAGDIWTKERYGDFVLEVEFKTKGNSGIFIRTDRPTDEAIHTIMTSSTPPSAHNPMISGVAKGLSALTRMYPAISQSPSSA